MDSKQVSQLTFGLIVVMVGLILLGGQLQLGWSWSRLWPVVFVLLGAAAFLKGDNEGRANGVWFLFLGAIFLMHTFRVLRLGDSWPLFIIAGGIAMMFPRKVCATPKRIEP